MQRKTTIDRSIRIASALVLALTLAGPAAADDRKQLAFEVVDRNAQAMTDISDSIYYFGELGMQEFETAKLLKDTLTAAGFRVEVRAITNREVARLGTSWAGRLAHGRERRFCEVTGVVES